MRRADLLEKTLILGKIKGRRRRGWQRMKWLDGITGSMDVSLSRLKEVVKEEREKAGLKLNIQKTKIMPSGPISSWQVDGETMETVTDFIFLGSKITADGDCSHEIKRHLLLGKKL